MARQIAWFRPYASVRQVVHTVHGPLSLQLQAGWTADGDREVGPYLGADLKLADEDAWTPTFSVHAGVRVVGPSDTTLRLGLTAYHGIDDAGRRRPARESAIGLGLIVYGPRKLTAGCRFGGAG